MTCNMTVSAQIITAHLATYWVSASIFLALDLYWAKHGITKYKIMEGKRHIPSMVKIRNAIVLTLLNQALSIPIIGILAPYGVSTHNPSYLEYVLVFAFYAMCADQWFYWSHRILHIPVLYRNIHYVHHKWTYPIALRAVYAHPVEHIVGNLGSLAVGTLLYPMPLRFVVVWTCVATLNAILAHCGTKVPGVDVGSHDLHHRVLSCNFGSSILSDQMYGTHRGPINRGVRLPYPRSPTRL